VPVSFCAEADRRTILVAAVLASSMGFIDSSVTSIPIPAMRAALGATLPQAQWIDGDDRPRLSRGRPGPRAWPLGRGLDADHRARAGPWRHVHHLGRRSWLALAAPLGEFWSLVVPLAALAGTGLGLDVASLTAAEMQGAADGEQGAASGINTAVARAAGLAAVAVLGRVAAWSHGDAAPGFGVPGDGPAHLAATGTGFGTIALIASLSAALAAALALCVTRAVR